MYCVARMCVVIGKAGQIKIEDVGRFRPGMIHTAFRFSAVETIAASHKSAKENS